mgnify:CR=1 FL=1
MENKYSVVLTTTASKKDAETIASSLLEKKLAACIQVTEIKSYYTWKDKVNVDDEQVLLIKSKAEDYDEIEECIRANHSYEVPEIIRLPIESGFSGYLNWITEVTK